MSLVVIAVLAVIWVIALTPMMLRKLSERRFSNSVDSFHRQLRGMRRAYPRLAASAVDPEMALSATATADDGVWASSPVTPSRVPRSEVSQHRPRRLAPQSARRRRVLLVLVTTMLGFFLLGMVPGLKVLWDLALLAFAATAGYLALLIHIHRRAVERDVKVVDIQERLRNQNANATADTVIPVRRIEPEDVDWSDDELLGPAFGLDYDEIMAGGR
ncbi:MAG: hypothetical protein ABSF89_14805 [Acidimicrobiales bacterium]